MSDKAKQKLDLITLGRVGVDLYGEQINSKLEDISSFKKYVGGCPANIAIGSARLGLSTALISKVGNDHMGRFILNTLCNEKVNTSQITTDPQRLTALVLLSIKNKNEFPLLFYRENCADMALDEQNISPEFIASAKALLVTGTHFSNSGVNRASRKAILAAKDSATKVILDIDYRPVLWGLTNKDNGEQRYVDSVVVTETLQTILPLCDLIVGTAEEFHIAGGSEDTQIALSRVRELSNALLVLKLGEKGCMVFNSKIPDNLDSATLYPGFKVNVLNVLGAGDAFMAGFLAGWLRDVDIKTSCEYANACGALVVSRHGCSPEMPSIEELDTYLDHYSDNPTPDANNTFAHIHYASNRYKKHNELKLIAFDHRLQFLELAKKYNKDIKDIIQAKNLIGKAAKQIIQQHPDTGVIIDDQYAAQVLNSFNELDCFIARPVETPNQTPLRFSDGKDLTKTLSQWPINHNIKCLVNYHPDDMYALRIKQEDRLIQLHNAARDTGHGLLIEIIPTPNSVVTEKTLSQILQRFYDIGLYPDWWKLPSPKSTKAFERIEQVIDDNDPFCQGVLLLGQLATTEQIATNFQNFVNFKHCKGFAIGRAIFNNPVIQWFSGKIPDNTLVDLVATNYNQVIAQYQKAKQSATTNEFELTL